MSIPTHNVQIVASDSNAQLEKTQTAKRSKLKKDKFNNEKLHLYAVSFEFNLEIKNRFSALLYQQDAEERADEIEKRAEPLNKAFVEKSDHIGSSTKR